MEKMKKNFEKGKRLFTHRIDSCRLKPGDHIYAYRKFGLYSHHGIYVGEDLIVHFLPTEANNVDDRPAAAACERCGYQKNVHLGVVKTCPDCFLSHGFLSSESVRLYQYKEHKLKKLLKRAGTCSTSACFPPEDVVQIANMLHKENCFGQYDLVKNNCEDFATFCRTGQGKSEQMEIPMVSSLVNIMKDNLKSSG